MARYYKIKIGSVWLTSDGTETGIACKTKVSGFSDSLFDKIGNTVKALDGTPITFLTVDLRKGMSILLEVPSFITSVFDDVKTELQDSLTNKTLFELDIIGETGTFNLLAKPDMPTPLDSESFGTGYIKNIKIKLITAGVYTP